MTDGVNSGFSPADTFLTNSNDTINLVSIDLAKAKSGGIYKTINIMDNSSADNDTLKMIINGTAGGSASSDLSTIKTTGIETLEITNSNADLNTTAALTLKTNFKGLQTINLKGSGFDGSGINVDNLGAITLNGTEQADTLYIASAVVKGAVFNGNGGTDTISLASGKTYDLTNATVKGFENIKFNGSSASNVVIVAANADLKEIDVGDSTGAKAIVKGDFNLQKDSADEVTKAGDFYITSNASGSGEELVYFDAAAGEAITIKFVGASGDNTIKVVNGDVVFTAV